MLNLLKIDIKDTRTTKLALFWCLLLILNKFSTLFWFFHCWLGTIKYWLEILLTFSITTFIRLALNTMKFNVEIIFTSVNECCHKQFGKFLGKYSLLISVGLPETWKNWTRRNFFFIFLFFWVLSKIFKIIVRTPPESCIRRKISEMTRYQNKTSFFNILVSHEGTCKWRRLFEAIT